jgi:hypothetical protein
MESHDELPRLQRSYAAACLGAFKALGVVLVGGLLVSLAIRSPSSVFQPGAPLVQKYGLSRMILATEAIGGLVMIVGAAWMASAIRAAARLLSRIRVLRADARPARLV